MNVFENTHSLRSMLKNSHCSDSENVARWPVRMLGSGFWLLIADLRLSLTAVIMIGDHISILRQGDTLQLFPSTLLMKCCHV